MAQVLAHRGPDDEGFWCEGPVGLAQKRLSIIDLKGGHQPLANEDQSVWITFNGEIYNYPSLMSSLIREGHTFSTRSDTETIVHAYEEHGLDFVKRLNGMFAFALWDKKANQLVLARDPFGIKPLYIWDTHDGLAFSSEIKSFLTHPEFSREVDLQSLDEYLTFQFVPSPRTIFKGVYKLQPGHCLVLKDGVIRIIQYAFKEIQQIHNWKEQSLIGELQALIHASIKRQMVSDVPVGALLSGGVDSAVVAAIMSEISSSTVKTFTVGFEGGFNKNELGAARRTAQLLGTQHQEVIIGSDEFLKVFPATIWHMDEPVATTSALAMYWVSQLAAESVKVVLTGQGADEPWAGYRRYRGEKLGAIYRKTPEFIRNKVIGPITRRVPRAESLKRSVYALGNNDPVERFTNIYTVFTKEMKTALYQDWLSKETQIGPICKSLQYWQSQVNGLDPLSQQLFLETRFSLADNLLLYGDKMAMASSLEARVPLLDLELMDFVENLPSNLKLHGLKGHKYLYRKAVRKWLPKEIMNRPKIGFLTPIDVWMQKGISTYTRELLTTPGNACSKYFNTDVIETLICDHISRREDNSRALFTLMVFENWFKEFMVSA
jgi:asparagine synthase (glutamine-hydrolysing)